MYTSCHIIIFFPHFIYICILRIKLIYRVFEQQYPVTALQILVEREIDVTLCPLFVAHMHMWPDQLPKQNNKRLNYNTQRRYKISYVGPFLICQKAEGR